MNKFCYIKFNKFLFISNFCIDNEGMHISFTRFKDYAIPFLSFRQACKFLDMLKVHDSRYYSNCEVV